jgi:hypothetical protein
MHRLRLPIRHIDGQAKLYLREKPWLSLQTLHPWAFAAASAWRVPRLAPLWNAHRHRRLVEPFCGGMAVTSGLLPYRALLNDGNPHLMNFYRQLQRGFRIEMPTENNEVLFCAYGTRFSLLVLLDGAIGDREVEVG